VSNRTLHIDLKTPYVSEVIKEYSTNYFHKLANHPNPLLGPLTTKLARRSEELKKTSLDADPLKPSEVYNT
jgi:hypothetical protein